MKLPLTFSMYIIASVLTMEYIVPILAILIVGGFTFTFYWFIVKNLPKTLKQEYKLMLEDVKKLHRKGGIINLCIVANRRSKLLQLDLKARLSALDKTDPDLFTYYSDKPHITSKQISISGSSFWKNDDLESRVEFLKRVITRVK